MGNENELKQAEDLSQEVSKMLAAFIEKLRPATKKLKAES